MAEDFGIGSSQWNETWDDFLIINSDHVASRQELEDIATNNTVWAGMKPSHQHNQPSSTTVLYNLPEESTLRASELGNFQNNDYSYQ